MGGGEVSSVGAAMDADREGVKLSDPRPAKRSLVVLGVV